VSDRLHARSNRAKGKKGPARAPRAFGPASDPEVAARFRAAAEAKPSRGPKPAKGRKGPTKASAKAKTAPGPRSAKRPKAPKPPTSVSDKRSRAATKRGPRRLGGRRPLEAAAASKAGSSPSTDAQEAASARRRRIPLAVAATFAVVVLVASFPLGALLSQHHQLSAAAAQLRRLQGTNRSLAEQQRQLNSTTAIDRLAREDYQMVSPGQTLYVVLPPGGKPGRTTAGGPTAGDPGTQPLVAPANAPDMSPDPGLSQQASTGGSGSSSGAAGPGSRAGGGPSGTAGAQSTTSFWGRVTNSLEFWK